MAKKLTPYEKVDNFITKCHDVEVDKWNAGLSNNADEWENFIEYWNLIDEVVSLRKDNAELRMYNNKLNTEVEFKEKKYQELLTKYNENDKVITNKELIEKLQKWFKLLCMDSINSKLLVRTEIKEILEGGRSNGKEQL